MRGLSGSYCTASHGGGEGAILGGQMVHFLLSIRSSLGPGRSPQRRHQQSSRLSAGTQGQDGHQPGQGQTSQVETGASGRDRGTGASASSSSMCCYLPCLQQKGLQVRAPPPPHPPIITPITKMRGGALSNRGHGGRWTLSKQQSRPDLRLRS